MVLALAGSNRCFFIAEPFSLDEWCLDACRGGRPALLKPEFFTVEQRQGVSNAYCISLGHCIELDEWITEEGMGK